MSFVTAQPEALEAAAGHLQAIGSSLSAQNAAGATPTTGVVPAAADEVSALTAAQFGAQGSLYQQVSAQAAAIHEKFVATMNGSAGSYAATEAANLTGLSSPATAVASAASGPQGLVGTLTDVLSNNPLNGLLYLVGNPINNAFNSVGEAAAYIAPGLLPTLIGYLTHAGSTAAGGGAIGGGLGGLLAPGGPLGALGALGGGAAASGAAGAASAAAGTMSATAPAVSATVGHASLVGSSLSVPPSWAAATPASTATSALPASGWAAAPEHNSMAAMPGGIPGGAGRGGYGFGTPRYGFKPTVMPRPMMVG
jgi:hypothetical protein